jgi:hypothetical protein
MHWPMQIAQQCWSEVDLNLGREAGCTQLELAGGNQLNL